MALEKVSSGVLFEDLFDRPDGSLGPDWEAEAGPLDAWSIVNNHARISHDLIPNNSYARIRPKIDVLAPVTNGRVSVQWNVVDSSANGAQDARVWDPVARQGYVHQISRLGLRTVYLVEGESETQLTGDAGSAHTTLTVAPGVVRLGSNSGNPQHVIETGKNLTGYNVRVSIGSIRQFNDTGRFDYEYVIVATSHEIIVGGMPFGSYARIRRVATDVTEVVSDSEVDREVRLNVERIDWTAPYRLEILDENDNIVETYTGRLCGGDIFVGPNRSDIITARVNVESHAVEVEIRPEFFSPPESRQLHRSTTADFTEYVTLPLEVAATEYFDMDVEFGTTYYYRSHTDLGPSNVASVTMPAAPGTPPSKPTLTLKSVGEDFAEFRSGPFHSPANTPGMSVELWIETRTGTPVMGPLSFPIFEDFEWRDLYAGDIPNMVTREFRARIRHRDELNVPSEYSDWVDVDLLNPSGGTGDPEIIEGPPPSNNVGVDVYPRGGLTVVNAEVPRPDSFEAPDAGCQLEPFDVLLPFATISPYPSTYWMYSAWPTPGTTHPKQYTYMHMGTGTGKYGIPFRGLYGCAIADTKTFNMLMLHRSPKVLLFEGYLPFGLVPPYIFEPDMGFTPLSNLVQENELHAQWYEPPSHFGSLRTFFEIMWFAEAGYLPETLESYGEFNYSVVDETYFEFEYTTDAGQTWHPLDTVPFGRRYFMNHPTAGLKIYTRKTGHDYELSTDWSHTFDLSRIEEDGVVSIRVRCVAPSDDPVRTGPWRVSRPFILDREKRAFELSGEDLRLDNLDIFGYEGEEERWTDLPGGGVRRTQHGGDAVGSLGLATPKKWPTPRSFEVIVTCAFTSRHNTTGSVSSGLLFLDERDTTMGAAGYIHKGVEGISALLAGSRGEFPPFGYYRPMTTSMQEGPYANRWSYWESGYRFGRGGFRNFLGKLGPGTEEYHTRNAQDWFTLQPAYDAHVHAFSDPISPESPLRPYYTFRYRVTLEGVNTNGKHRLRVQLAKNGPANEDPGWITDEIYDREEWPCGRPGFFAENRGRGKVSSDFLSIAVLPLSEGDCEPEPETLPNEKAWMFTLDGHVFYVLNVVATDSGAHTYVYDLTTGQWHRWYTGYRPWWNMFRGIVWKGRTIAADHEAGTVWELDPDSELDEGEDPIRRAVTGILPHRGRTSVRQGNLRLYASMGEPSRSGAVVQMRFSDDGGQTWSDYYRVNIRPGVFAQRPRFRSLGRIRAPGRVWEISDDGASMRIDGLDAALDTDREEEEE